MLRTPKLEPIDLRSVSRDSDRALLEIFIGTGRDPWIKAGRATLQKIGRGWLVKVRAHEGITDCEHDSAYVLYFSILGLEMEYCESHFFRYKAVMGVDPDNFNVPSPGYNPEEVQGTEMCARCPEPHPIVPSGHWMPPFERDLFRKVAGQPIEILMGVPYPDEEEEE